MNLRTEILGALTLLPLFVQAAPPVNVRDFGATGDATTDDTDSIRKALTASNHVHFPAGVYVITDGIDLPENARLTGDGTPSLGVFPRGGDAKDFLSPGQRIQLPGTTLLFRGTGKKSAGTGRRDVFESMRYALKTAPVTAFSIEKLAIALDVDVSDSNGKLTTPNNDNRSDFDVGLLIDDSAAGTVRDVSVFGYWKKAGMSIVSRGLGDNPDYNTFWNCSFMGEHGVALLGLHDEKSPGLSGTQFHGCRIFANDHHFRAAGQWGTAAVYIDGDTNGKRADLNGHYFFGGCIRTYNNTAVKLDHASNISFHGVVFEVPRFDGKHNQGADTTGKVEGTEKTRDVHFFGCRMHDIGINELGTTVTDGSIVAFPDAFGAISVHKDGKLVRLNSSHPRGPTVQLARDGTSANHDWNLRYDEGGSLSFRYDNQLQATLSNDGKFFVNETSSKRIQARDLSVGKPLISTVENKTAVVRSSRVQLSSQKPTPLNDLTAGEEGQLLILEFAPNSAEIEIIGDGNIGNIELSTPFAFTTSRQRLTLMRSLNKWVELSRVE